MGALSGIMEVSKYTGKQGGPSDVCSKDVSSQNPSGGVCNKDGNFANLRELTIHGVISLS